LLAVIAATSAAADHDESSLKVEFLRAFIDFIEWPVVRPTLTVCGIGNDDLGDAFGRLEDHRVRKSALAVRHHVNSKDWLGCDVVYVSAHERKHIESLAIAMRGHPVLLVADIDGAAQLGATLSLHSRSGRFIGFDANQTVAQDVGLKVSSKLLKLARRVY
jgi:hypothetical protein